MSPPVIPGREQRTGALAQNFVLGAGSVMACVLGDDDAETGWRDLGSSRACAVQTEEQRFSAYDPDGPTGEKIVDVVTQLDQSVSLTLEDISLDNLALWLGGAVETGAQEAAAAKAKIGPIRVEAGRTYRIGATADRPLGYRNLAAPGAAGTVVAKTQAGAHSAPDASGLDYVLDADRGQIYVKAAAADQDIWITPKVQTAYTPEYLKSTDKATTRVAILYQERPAAGKGRSVLIRLAEIGPGGAWQLKADRQSVQQLLLTAGILEFPGHPRVVIYESA